MGECGSGGGGMESGRKRSIEGKWSYESQLATFVAVRWTGEDVCGEGALGQPSGIPSEKGDCGGLGDAGGGKFERFQASGA